MGSFIGIVYRQFPEPTVKPKPLKSACTYVCEEYICSVQQTEHLGKDRLHNNGAALFHHLVRQTALDLGDHIRTDHRDRPGIGISPNVHAADLGDVGVFACGPQRCFHGVE